MTRRIWLGLALGAAAWAHDLVLRVELAPPAVVVQAAYGGTEPVPFAKVQVFQGEREWSAGVTDARGYYAFVPGGPGAWRVVVDDEMGHRTESTAGVPEPFRGAAAAPEAGSRWERALAGVALLLGGAGILYGYRARRAG